MLIGLFRLVSVVGLALAGFVSVLTVGDRLDEARIEAAAEHSVRSAAESVLWLVDQRPGRTVAQAAADLLARPVPARQTHAVVLTDGRVVTHPAGDGRISQSAGGLRTSVERVETVAGPAWRAAIPFQADGSVAAWYTIVEPFGTPLMERRWATVQMRLLGLKAAGALMVLGAAGLAARAFARRFGGSPESATRPLLAVVAEGSASRLAFGLLTFALPLYAYQLGMSVAGIGLLLATNTAVAIILKPAMGAAIDRVGVARSFMLAVPLRTCVVLALLAVDSPADLFAVRALHGVAIAIRDPASASVIAGLGGKSAVAQRFAWYQTAKTVAGAAGAFLAGILLSGTGGDFVAVFAVAAVLSGLPFVVVLWGLRGPAVAGLTLPLKPERAPMPADLRRSLLPYAGLGAMMTGTAYLMANLLPVLAVEHMGLAPAAASSLYLVKAGIGLTGPIWGWVSDHVSVRLVLAMRAAGNTVSSLVWLVVPTWSGLMAGKMADDVGKAAFVPAWGSVMASLSELDPSRRSRTLAWLGSAEDAGEMAGPVVAGVIWATLGLPALLVLRAMLAIGTEVWAMRLARRSQLPGEPGPHHELPARLLLPAP